MKELFVFYHLFIKVRLVYVSQIINETIYYSVFLLNVKFRPKIWTTITFSNVALFRGWEVYGNVSIFIQNVSLLIFCKHKTPL
jgi:hypothetical protein